MDIYLILFYVIIIFAFLSFLACVLSCCRMYNCFCGAFESIGMTCGCIERDYAYYENPGCCWRAEPTPAQTMFNGCRMVPYEQEMIEVQLCCQKREANCLNANCTICLDDFIVGENVVLCPCGHCYHKKCLKNWLRVKSECPLCKVGIGRRELLSERSPLIPPVWDDYALKSMCSTPSFYG